MPLGLGLDGLSSKGVFAICKESESYFTPVQSSFTEGRKIFSFLNLVDIRGLVYKEKNLLYINRN